MIKRISAHVAGAAVALGALAVGAHVTPAYAIQAGSANDYPLGILMGAPSGATPPDGVYLINRFSYGSGYAVNQEGARTGTRSTTVTDTNTFLFVPGITILGGRYSAAIIGVGFLDVQVNFSKSIPGFKGGATFNKIGSPDTLFVPFELSWKVADSTFVSADGFFYPPIGTYSQTDAVNTGNDRWAYGGDAAISYLGHGYNLTAHLDYEFNAANVQYNYTSGNTVDLDWTATKKFGRWEVGPVGYWYKQVTGDTIPGNYAFLNGGQPLEASAGLLVGYNFGPVAFQIMTVKDYIARATNNQTLTRGDISLKF